VDANDSLALIARADSACTIEGTAVHGGFFDELGTAALPYEFARF
jgi:hypothetical protein